MEKTFFKIASIKLTVKDEETFNISSDFFKQMSTANILSFFKIYETKEKKILSPAEVSLDKQTLLKILKNKKQNNLFLNIIYNGNIYSSLYNKIFKMKRAFYGSVLEILYYKICESEFLKITTRENKVLFFIKKNETYDLPDSADNFITTTKTMKIARINEGVFLEVIKPKRKFISKQDHFFQNSFVKDMVILGKRIFLISKNKSSSSEKLLELINGELIQINKKIRIKIFIKTNYETLEKDNSTSYIIYDNNTIITESFEKKINGFIEDRVTKVDAIKSVENTFVNNGKELIYFNKNNFYIEEFIFIRVAFSDVKKDKVILLQGDKITILDTQTLEKTLLKTKASFSTSSKETNFDLDFLLISEGEEYKKFVLIDLEKKEIIKETKEEQEVFLKIPKIEYILKNTIQEITKKTIIKKYSEEKNEC